MTKKLLIFFVVFLTTPFITYAAEQFPFVGEIKGHDVNVRSGQSVNFDRLTQLNKGDTVVVIGRNYSWYKIRLPQKAACYINKRYVEREENNLGVVTGGRVNLRARPSLTSTVIGKLKKGTLIRILKEVGDWYRIEPMKGIYGWVKVDFVKFHSFDVPPPHVIKRPTRNIYKKKEVSTGNSSAGKKGPPKRKNNFIIVSGKLEDLGRVVRDRNIRYKLVRDGKTAYYLIGQSQMFDPFINLRVLLQGEVKPDPNHLYPVPVIVVSKINLVL